MLVTGCSILCEASAAGSTIERSKPRQCRYKRQTPWGGSPLCSILWCEAVDSHESRHCARSALPMQDGLSGARTLHRQQLICGVERCTESVNRSQFGFGPFAQLGEVAMGSDRSQYNGPADLRTSGRLVGQGGCDR